MSEILNDGLAKYLTRGHRLDDASLWLSPQRVDAPNYMGPSEADEDLLDRVPTFTDFMVFAWPAQLSRSYADQRELWNVVERLVIQARLSATAWPPHPLEDLTQEIWKLSRIATPPLDGVLRECWDATIAMLSRRDSSVTKYFALGRLLSAYAACPGWGIALDIALCADWIDGMGLFVEDDDAFDIGWNLRRGAFRQIGDLDGAPSWVYLQAMLIELEDSHGNAARGRIEAEYAIPMAQRAAIALAKRSVDRPEHPWIELYLGDQLLCSTHLDELQDNSANHVFPLRVLYESEPPGLGSVRSVIVPIYALPNEDVTPEVEEQRSFGNAFGQHAMGGSFGPFPWLPRHVGLDCAYTAFGRAYLANGKQPGGLDSALAINAAAALTWLGVLMPRPGLFKCASSALLERLQAARIEPGSIPELERVTELATSRNLSLVNQTGTTVALVTRSAPSALQISSIARDLDRVDVLLAERGEEPRDWERGPRMRRAVRADLEQHPWWQVCNSRVRGEIAEAMTAKRLGLGPATWASRLGVALEETAKCWVEPLREMSLARKLELIDLGGNKPETVGDLRKNFSLGTMQALLQRWLGGRLADEVVLSFLDTRLDRKAGARLRHLADRAASLRNKAAHPDAFDEPSALDLEEVSFELFPLLLQPVAQ